MERVLRIMGWLLALSGALGAFTTEPVLLLRDTTQFFAMQVANAGDVNGDGYEDMLLAFPLDPATLDPDSSTGLVYVYFGGPAMDNVPDVVIEGPYQGIHFAYSVAGAGDLNGDGYDDIIVGAPTGTVFLGNEEGFAFIYFGGSPMDSLYDLLLIGDKEGAHLGWSVASAGDFNGDGYDDVIVGAPDYDITIDYRRRGAAFIYYGGPSMNNQYDAFIAGGPYYSDSHLGRHVAGIGDIDGDGYDDVAVGDPTIRRLISPDLYRGEAKVMRGGPFTEGTIMDLWPVAVIEGDSISTHNIGEIVTGIGDVNGDGYSDLAVYHQTGNTHRILIYLGPIVGTYYVGKGEYDMAIRVHDPHGTVAGGRDINGDGFDDFVISAFNDDLDNPFHADVYGYLGGPYFLGTSPDFTFTKTLWSHGEFGGSMALVDADGDNLAEVLVGNTDEPWAQLYDVYLYQLLSPVGGETWTVGTFQEIRWKGKDLADLYLSLDGGASWEAIAYEVAGHTPPDTAVYRFVVPHTPTRYALVRIVATGESPSDPNAYVESDTFFTIKATITLLSFRAEVGDDGRVTLNWQTDPGPEDLAGYHVYRLNADGTETRLTPEPIPTDGYVDETGSGARGYALAAVNGLGMEYRLGEVTLLQKPIAVVPTLVRRQARVIFYVPQFLTPDGQQHVQLDVIDVTGRRVQRLLEDRLSPGVHTVEFSPSPEWSSGIYFLVLDVEDRDRQVARFQVVR